MTALADRQVQLGDAGLLIGEGTNYRLASIEGVGRLIRERDSARDMADGDSQGPDFSQSRTVTLEIGIDAASDSAAMVLYDALAAAWNSCRGTEGAQSTTPLRWKLPGQAARRLEGGRPRRLEPSFANLGVGQITCLATYKAPDPRMLADDLGTGGTGERVIDLVIAAANVTLPNTGNHPAAVVWDVYGALTAAGVIRSEASRFDIAGTIANPTFFRVRTDPKTVTRSSDSANRYADRTGTWLEIPAGGALFRAVGTSPGINAKVRATYRDTWL